MGKRKYIETPEKLWEYFQEYKKETKSKFINPEFVFKNSFYIIHKIFK
jgi:hypothetical protein